MNSKKVCAILAVLMLTAVIPMTAVGTDGAGSVKSGTVSADGITVSYIDSATDGYGLLAISYDETPKGETFSIVIDGAATASFKKANLGGLLIPVLSVGNHTISVRSDADATRTVTLAVIVGVTSVTLDIGEKAVKKGETFTLTATVGPSDATDKTVIWSSSDDNIASVDAKGKVTAVNGGSAVITAESGGVKATCSVTVTVDVTGVSLDVTEKTAEKGETFTITATVEPSDATDKTVTWTSSNTSVATVDSDGKVTAVGGGFAVITATVGEKTATCNVTVTTDVTAVTLDIAEKTVKKGETFTLTATVAPSDVTDKKVTWSSDNDSVASVDSNGKVTAVGGGSAVITAAAGGKTATCNVTVTVPVSGVTLDVTEKSVATGESFTLTATVEPSDATDKTVTWTSSNATVATVDSNGKVTAIGTGSAVITATASGKTVTCNVTVAAIVNPDSSSTTEETNEDGSKTVTVEEKKTNTDGSSSESTKETTTSADGNKVSESETVVIKDESGNIKSTTSTVDETTTSADGTKTEKKTVEVRSSDGNTVKTESEKKTSADGKVTEEKKLSITDSSSKITTNATATVDSDGKVSGESTVAVKVDPVKTDAKAEYTLDSEAAGAILEQIGNVTTLVGDVTSTVKFVADDNSKTSEFTVPVSVIAKISESKGSMQFTSSDGTVTMGNTVVSSLKSEDSDLKVQISNVDKDTELPAEQRSKVGSNPVVRMTASTDGKDVHELGGNVTVSVPYELPDGKSASDVSAWYLADDGTITDMKGTYDAENGVVTFTTTHFSIYAVGIIEEQSAAGSDNTPLVVIALVIIVLLALGAFLFIRSRRNTGAE